MKGYWQKGKNDKAIIDEASKQWDYRDMFIPVEYTDVLRMEKKE